MPNLEDFNFIVFSVILIKQKVRIDYQLMKGITGATTKQLSQFRLPFE